MKRMIWMALLVAASAFAADVAGKWTGQMPTRGETANVTFVFTASGGTTAGTMTGPQGEAKLEDVKVEGDKISFSMTGGTLGGAVSGGNGNDVLAISGGTINSFVAGNDGTDQVTISGGTITGDVDA